MRARGIPLALHADLGNAAAPTRYLPLMEEVLCLYPENVIVWEVELGVYLSWRLTLGGNGVRTLALTPRRSIRTVRESAYRPWR